MSVQRTGCMLGVPGMGYMLGVPGTLAFDGGVG